MTERRPTNSELRLNRETEEQPPEEEPGIFVLWLDDAEPQDEDAPLARDDARD